MAIKHMDTVQVHVLSSDMTDTAWWGGKNTGFSDRQITPPAAAAAYILFLYTSDMMTSLYTEKTGFALSTAAILIWYDMAKKTSRSFAMIINSCITDGHFYPSLKCWKSA